MKSIPMCAWNSKEVNMTGNEKTETRVAKGGEGRSCTVFLHVMRILTFTQRHCFLEVYFLGERCTFYIPIFLYRI